MIRSLIQKLAVRTRKILMPVLLMASTVFVAPAGPRQVTISTSDQTATAFPQLFSDFQKASRVETNSNGHLFPDIYTYVSQPSDEVDKEVRPLWENLQILKTQETVIGQALAEFAMGENIFYAYDENKDGPFGYWRKSEGMIYINKTLPKNYQALVQAHETLHSKQFRNGLEISSNTASIYTIQLARLSSEAAGMTVSYLLAIELAEKGLVLPWQEMLARGLAFSNHTRQVRAAWDSLRASNMPYLQALTETGKFSFCEQLKMQWWLDGYNHLYLVDYLEKTIKGEMEPISNKMFSLADFCKVGEVSPEFNFTAGFTSIPSMQSLFGSNMSMVHAFECAELYRIGETSGMHSALYKEARAQAIKNGNPYIGLDMEEAFNTYCDDQVESIIAVLDQMKKNRDSKPGPKQQKIRKSI